MSAVLGLRQNLGIFQKDLPAIVAAMSREEKTMRTRVDKYTVLDLAEDPPFPQKGCFKTIYYCVSKALGAGDFTVHVALRSDPVSASWQREKRILSILNKAKGVHQPLCIQALGDFEYMISELFNRGDLFSFIFEQKFVSESFDAHWIAHSIVYAVSECHSKGIVLRDLKLENILIRQLDNGSYEIKLIDFGHSYIVNEDTMTESKRLCGSLIYFPPEDLKFYKLTGSLPTISYSRDLWALGAILFILATKEFPVIVHKIGPDNREKIDHPKEPKYYIGLFDREIRDLLYLSGEKRPSAKSIHGRMRGIFVGTYPNLQRNGGLNESQSLLVGKEVVLYSPLPPSVMNLNIASYSHRPIFDENSIEEASSDGSSQVCKKLPSLPDWVEANQIFVAPLDNSKGVLNGLGIYQQNEYGDKQQDLLGNPQPRSLLSRFCCCFRRAS